MSTVTARPPAAISEESHTDDRKRYRRDPFHALTLHLHEPPSLQAEIDAPATAVEAGAGAGAGSSYLPMVATRMALMVCRRFSAWSNTMLAGDPKTSRVTSNPEVIPVCSIISRPTVVFGSWNAGRQCMNLTLGLSEAAISVALTW